MTKRKNIAVVGATGAVGTVFLKMLEERNFPVDELRLCASERSVGKRIKVNGVDIKVELITFCLPPPVPQPYLCLLQHNR